MRTNHIIFFEASQHMSAVKDTSVDLVVTSPPYPMIGMWDDILSCQNPVIAETLRMENQRKPLNLCTKNWIKFGMSVIEY